MKTWHDCPCGESIAVPDSPFGQAVLTEWQRKHAGHLECAAKQPSDPGST